MSIEVRKKQNESVSVFLRRFSDQVKRSGVINQYKSGQFYVRDQSRRLKKLSALARKKQAERMAFLRKIGKIK